MCAAPIGTGNSLPSRDGEMNLYESPEVSGKTWFDRLRRVIFVNGMMNSPQNHKDSAMQLSMVQGCPVLGIFNKSDGFWADLGQCITDKATMFSPGITVPPGIRTGTGSMADFKLWQDFFDAVAKSQPHKRKEDVIGQFIQSNAGTYALYTHLLNRKSGPLRIFCHSQGNLLTSNALTALSLARGRQALAGIEVLSYGSPCRYWPEGIKRTNYAFSFDPVTWMDYRISFDNVKIGTLLPVHGFEHYMNNDAEFIVNRFRWGGLGMTLSMDETGLARYMADRIGNNPRRLKKIFEHLRDYRSSDSDDVAYLYTKMMRTKRPAILQQMKNSTPDLIDLIWTLMDKGWTSGSEYDEMSYLKSL